MKVFRRKAQQGYGIALIVVFGMSLLISILSLQMFNLPNQQPILTSQQNNVSSYYVASAAVADIQADLLNKLNNGQVVDTSYSYTGTVTAPADPGALAGTADTVGTYTATVTQTRGDLYLVTIIANVNGTQVSVSKLMQIQGRVCSAIEAAIFAGNIGSLSDAQLQKYAQQGCMLKTASLPSVEVPTIGSGSSTCNTYSGSGTLSLATVSSCGSGTGIRAGGTYDTIQYLSGTSTTGGSQYLYSYPASGTLRTVNIPGTIGNYDIFKAFNNSGTISTIAHKFLFNGAAVANSFVMYGGNGDDTFSFNGSSNADIDTNNGNNTIIVNGIWSSGADSNTVHFGSSGQGHTGTNKAYADTIRGTTGFGLYTYSSGNSEVYFNNFGGGKDITINLGSGNDIIGCGVSFTGGAGVCGSAAAGTGTFQFVGGTGNDIISIDMLLSATTATTISGNTGTTTETTSNIIYTKGCGASTTIRTNNTASLVISGGNRASGCTINGQGGSSVLLKKSGTTDAGTNSNFARTITY